MPCPICGSAYYIATGGCGNCSNNSINALNCKNCGNRIDKDPRYVDFLCTKCGATYAPNGNLLGYTFFTNKPGDNNDQS